MKKIRAKIIIPIILFFIISIIIIYSSQNLLSSQYNSLYIKQIIWYIIGFILIILLNKNKHILNNNIINILYIIGNILLLLVLLFGTVVNGAKCWFSIPYIGSFQPSEFMKIILILMLSKEVNKCNKDQYKRNIKNEIIVILKCFLITLIPTVLTFLEPDTGAVIIYFVILISILFIFGIRYRWFLIGIIVVISFLYLFLNLFFNNQEKFINIFGTDFFYRIDRLLDWKSGSGMQLTNALASSGSAGLFGYGFKKNPIYFPEPQTDFIFSVFLTNFGFIGGILLITIIIYFDSQMIKIGINSEGINKYIISGFLSVIIFQQIQNIGMNLGLLPITGITLPFISYGGSSLISYMIIIALILNIINKKDLYYKN